MILFKLFFSLLSASFFLAISATALAGLLVFTGSPSTCVDRSVNPAPEAISDLEANWFGVLQGVGQGETLPLSVTEAQASTLGQAYLRGQDVPIEDLQVFFCPDGTAEALGKLSIAGISSDMLAKGTLDVSGAQPRIEVESVEVGNVPDFVSERLVNLVLDEERVRTLPLSVNITELQISDGEAIAVIGP